MIFKKIPSGPFATNAYVVACPRTLLAVIIDPAPGSFEAITSFIKEKTLKPAALFITHSHWDHIAEAANIKEKYDIPVYIHPLDLPNLESPGADGLPCWIEIKPLKPTNLIEEGFIINFGDLEFKVIHTPGHSPGCVCFYLEKENCLFSGDTLFKGTIGNLSFPTARPSLMWESLAKLSLLPPSTIVYPGHGLSTTIGNESWLKNAKETFSDN